MVKSPGDYTGRQKAKLQQEAQERQEQEASRLTMITAEESKAKSNEVIDYTNKKKVRKQETGPGTKVDPEPVDLSEGGDHREARGELTSATTPEPVLDEVIDTSQEPRRSRATVVEKTSVLVRARYDLPEVTIGHGNHYDFEAGRRYRISQDAAIQLSERDLIDILE